MAAVRDLELGRNWILTTWKPRRQNVLPTHMFGADNTIGGRDMPRERNSKWWPLTAYFYVRFRF